MKKIAPSILNADFAHLNDEIKAVEAGGIEYLHLDVMDGNFVPNISFGAGIVEVVNKISDVTLDVHLMIEKPENYIDDFVKAGADIITVHVEACKHLQRTLQQIRSHGVKVGVALNPATPLCHLNHIMDDIDMVLLMTVNPGFGGAAFIPSIVDKIKDLKAKINGSSNKDIKIEVDGGINEETGKLCADAGADILVAGSFIYKSADKKATIKTLHDAINS